MSALQFHRLFMRIAFSIAHVFAWVGAFDFYYFSTHSWSQAFSELLFTYALTHVVAILLTPIAARLMRHGVRRALMLGVISSACAFLALGWGYAGDTESLAWSITAFALFLGIYRAMYFVPYSVSESSAVQGTFRELLIALMPGISGVLLLQISFMPAALYLFAAALLVFSLVPVLSVPVRLEGFSWKYRETFHNLFDTRNRKLLITGMCEGIEATALLLIWPIAIWLMTSGSYPLLGVVISCSLLLTMFVKRALRFFEVTTTPIVAMTIVVSAWIFRALTGNVIAVMAVDSYSGGSSGTLGRGMDTAALEQAADNHTYVDEYSALKEMAHALGRILLCVALGFLAPSNSLNLVFGTAFLVAACSTGIGLYVSRAHARTAF